MKKITLLTVIFMTIMTSASAQNSLYEQIEKNGTETEYREFYSVSKGEKKGTTMVSGMRYWVKASVVKLESGEKIGFKLTKVDGSGDLVTNDVMSGYIEAKGYPIVSYIYHKKDNDGYIATDDYIIELNNISSDGLSFESIESVFVKKQVKEKEEKKEETDTGKKKKGAKLLKRLEASVVKAYGEDKLPSAELKKASAVDLHQIALDYLKAIDSIQKAYTLTSKDKADLAKIKAAKEKKYADIKKANSDYWKSDAGQAVLARENKTNMKVYNSTNNTIWIVDEDGNTGFVKAGLTFDFKCSKRWYYAVGQDRTRGEFIGGGSSSYCSKKITL